MLKKILIGALTTLVVAAVGASAYNTTIKPGLAQSETEQAAAAIEAPVSSDTSADASAALAEPFQAAGNTPAQQQARGGGNGPGSPAASGEPLSAGAPGGYGAASAAPASGQVQTGSGGQGRGNRFGGGGAGRQAQSGSAVPSPQNGLTEWITLEGIVSQVAYPTFTLTTSDGKSILVSLGNLNFAASLRIDLSDGEAVSLTGFWDVDGTLAVGSLQADGQSYLLRDELGRPLWSGGASH